MISHSPGTEPNRDSSSQQDHPDTHHLNSYNILPNIETNLFIAVTEEKNPEYTKEALTTINEPFHFIISQDRDVYDSDSFEDHQHELHFLPNEFLVDQKLSEHNIDTLRYTDDSEDVRRHCLGCSYQTTNKYTISHMDTFIQYNDAKYKEYVYCDNCIQRLSQFISDRLFVENFEKEIAVWLG